MSNLLGLKRPSKEEIVAEQVERLKDPDWRIRFDAVRHLGNVGGESAFNVVVEQVGKGAPEIQWMAASALNHVMRVSRYDLRGLPWMDAKQLKRLHSATRKFARINANRMERDKLRECIQLLKETYLEGRKRLSQCAEGRVKVLPVPKRKSGSVKRVMRTQRVSV